MFTILVVLQIIIAICFIVLVLLQQGKGAEAGAALAGGSSGVLSTATGASTLTKITAALAVVFIVNSLVMASMSSSNRSIDSVIIQSDDIQQPVKESDKSDKDVPLLPTD